MRSVQVLFGFTSILVALAIAGCNSGSSGPATNAAVVSAPVSAPLPSPTAAGAGFPAPFTPSRTVTVCASGCNFTLLSQAVAAAQDYEQIQVQAGTYTDCAAIAVAHLWIQGVGGAFAQFQNQVCNTMGILVGGGQQLVVDNLEFSGMAISAADGNNAAGIRLESGDLTVRNCYFHDGQEGILTDNSGTGAVLIQSSHFARLGVDGQEHDMYIGTKASLTLQNSLVEQGNQGNVVKTRAYKSVVQCNQIMNGYDATYPKNGYLIDLPNGGEEHIDSNLIAMGPDSPQHYMVEYGGEGTTNPTQTLEMSGNYVINDFGGGTDVLILNPPASGTLSNNLFIGGGTTLGGSSGTITQTGDQSSADRASAGLSGQFPMPPACSGTVGTLY